MATLTVYATASGGDTYVDWGAVYATIHNAAGEFKRDTVDQAYVGNDYVGGYGYQIIRGFLFFDTSALGAGAVISAATLSLYGKESTEADADHLDVGIVEGVQDDPLEVADYGDHRLKTTLGADSYYDVDTWNIAGYNDKALNATGLGWISKTGTTKFCLRSKGDIDIATPTGRNYLGWWTSEKGEGYYPRLVITYTEGVLFPSDDVARVSSIRHIFRPGFFRMQVGLGDLGFDIDVAETAVRAALDTAKEVGEAPSEPAVTRPPITPADVAREEYIESLPSPLVSGVSYPEMVKETGLTPQQIAALGMESADIRMGRKKYPTYAEAYARLAEISQILRGLKEFG